MMLGVPLLGILFSTPPVTWTAFFQFLFFLLASFAVAGHVYTMNDLCGLTYDIYDQHKLERPIHSRQLRAREVFVFSVLMLMLGLAINYFLNSTVLLLSLIIIILWIIYAFPATLFKGIPIITSVMNGLGAGILPFLLGYVLFADGVDTKGILLSLYFGIIAGAGQLNREIIDIEPDSKAHLTTTAVKFGRRPTYIWAFILFVFSSIYFALLTVKGFLPSQYLTFIPFVGTGVHSCYFLKYLKTDLRRDFVIEYVKIYRAIYAFVGIAILVVCLVTLLGIRN